MYDKTVETKTATRVPSIDSKAESANWARPVGRRAATLPVARVCARQVHPMALSQTNFLQIQFSEMLHHGS